MRAKFRRAVQKHAPRRAANEKIVQRNEHLEPPPDGEMEDRRGKHLRPGMHMHHRVAGIMRSEFAIQGTTGFRVPHPADKCAGAVGISRDFLVPEKNDSQTRDILQGWIDGAYRREECGWDSGGRQSARRPQRDGTRAPGNMCVIVENEDPHESGLRPDAGENFTT